MRENSMKRVSVFVAAGLALLTLCVLSISGGCTAPKNEGFAIYLTANETSPQDMMKLSTYSLANKPIISTADVVSYNSSTHEITLTHAAYERVAGLQVLMMGKSFVVCVDKKPVYWGVFMAYVSSYLFPGVTIMQPLPNMQFDIITIDLGYPSTGYYDGVDPRGNTEIMQALRQANKLTGVAATADVLPKSMKGYDLYSWQQNEEWHFTLITGTNRNKTTDEIIKPSNTVTAEGWVQINITGVDAVKTVLGRIPQGEWVSWMSGPLDALTGITFARLDADTVAEIQNYALQRGLNFNAR
jgi:hypothetical protein